MQSEDQVAKQLADVAEMAKSNKNIDATALAFQALAQAQADEVAVEKKKRAYWVSVLLPPFGLFYAVVYFFNGTDDGKRVARNCVLFTLISGAGALLLTLWLGASLTSEQKTQVESVNMSDYRQMQDLVN